MKDNPFPYSHDNKRYHTLAFYFKREFGCRVFKVPVDMGCSCPNRDGSKGYGGCTYCLGGGGGSFAEAGALSIASQFHRGVEIMRRKWPQGTAVVYFQSFTNTWLPLERLRKRIDEALSLPGVEGIAIATRPDALPPETVDYLEELSRGTWLCVELGLQTVHDRTAERINRCHSYKEFLDGYEKLRERGIKICVHLINGLPGESREDMLESARRLGKLQPHSVKFHMLHILRETPIAEEYLRERFPLLRMDEYISILCGQLELLPPETVIQRISGDPPAKALIAPDWTLDKLRVRNALDIELARLNIMQGQIFSK